MLAGLIFATENAEDRPDRLAATLPFGGLTLVEFQARLLTAAGAGHIVLVVSRMTPELLGASNRISRRVSALDIVRTVGEVVEKVHPLSRVLVIADGVATTADAVQLLTASPGDALLTLGDGMPSADFERIGIDGVWGGLAIVDAERLAEVAALPRDWSFQSALLRVTAQAGAMHVALPPNLTIGHDVERHSARLAARGDAAVAALIARPSRWADRFVIGPAARMLLRAMIARGVGTGAPLGIAGALAAGMLAASWLAAPLATLLLGTVMLIAAATGAAAAGLRDEIAARRGAQIGPGIVLGIATLIGVPRMVTGAAGLLAAAALIATAVLVERATTERVVARWWASPAALVLVMIPASAFLGPLPAVLAATVYAAVTLAAAIEAWRGQP